MDRNIDKPVKAEWYRSPIDREELRKLTKKRNLRPFIHIVALMGMSIVTGAITMWAFYRLAWPLVLLFTYIHCSLYGFFGGGTGCHELSHRTVFKSKAPNEFFIRLLGLITQLNFVQFRGNHTKHHLHTTIPGIDLEVMLPLTYKPSQWFWAFTIDLPYMKRTFIPMFMHFFGFQKEGSRQSMIAYPSKDQKDIRSMKLWARLILLVHIGLATFFILSGNWILIFLVTLAPHLARWLVIFTHQPQHIGMQGNITDWRKNTRTYLAGPFIRFLYWNMNYHVEHHMFASVPFYNLPALRKSIQGDIPLAPRGLIATWREIFLFLKKNRSDPGFFIKPEFPETAILR